MVAWGMGHNLEKNLRRVQTLREKGELDRALKQLQEWARRHPDTPHYLFEAAIAAFDLKDWGAGIASLRTLLRNLPDTREKVLTACQQRFDETPAVPLAEFLVEASLHDGDLEHCVRLIGSLEPPDQSIYARKTSMRHESALATPQTPGATIRASHVLQTLVGCAIGDGSVVTASIGEVLKSDEATVAKLEGLTALAADAHPMEAQLRAAHARCLLHQGELARGSEELVEAARRDPDQRSSSIELLAGIAGEGPGRGRWLRARADLELLALDGAAAARLFLESADADATLRESLLERLAEASGNDTIQGREEILKLRLRLMVVQKHFDQIPDLAQRLIDEGFAEPQEMRALLGEGQKSEQLPSEMLVVCAETALRDHDLAAAAKHIHEISNADEASLKRVSAKIEQLLPDWDPGSKLQLEAMNILLLGRMKREEAANQALAEAWRLHPTEIDTLVAITDRASGLVEPRTNVLRNAIAACADAQRALAARPLLESMLPEVHEAGGGDEPLFGSPRSGGFSQEALDLDLGGVAPTNDEIDDISELVVDLIEERTERGPQILELLDASVSSTEQKRRLRHPFALAALWSERFDRALGELAVLTMMAAPSLVQRIGEQLDLAIEHFDDDADLLMVRADLLAEDDRIPESVGLLARALSADPRRAEELIERFDAMLEKIEDEDAPSLWEALANALYAVERFDRLEELCVRAQRELPESAQAPFLILRARTWLARGRFSEALQSIQQHMVAQRLPWPMAVEVLEDACEANPTSPVALLMLGQAATRANNPGRAFEAYASAIRLDATLEAPVADQIQNLAESEHSDSTLLMRIGRFYRDRSDFDRAALAIGRALDLRKELAERILGEYAGPLSSENVVPALLVVAARASRLAGRCSLACSHLGDLYRRDPAALETVIAEYRHLRDAFPGDVSPVEGMARVLLQGNARDAAVRVLVECGRDERFELKNRIELLEVFHGELPEEEMLSLRFAECMALAGRSDAALELLQEIAARSRCDDEEIVQVTQVMLRLETESAPLRLLHHDLLTRLGQPREALHALPVASSVPRERQHEISRRLLAREDLVLVDERLVLSLTASLHAEGDDDRALEIFRAASARTQFSATSPFWKEWAGLLHHCGRDREARDLLLARARNDEDRRTAFQEFARWSDEKIERELEALRQRWEKSPEDISLSFELASRLLDEERADEACELLRTLDVRDADKGRRGTLLGRAHLQLNRADLAEAILLDAIETVAHDITQRADLHRQLAECADRLGRPASATAHLQILLEHPEYQTLALARIRSTYARTLNQAAGEDRVALSALSSL